MTLAFKLSHSVMKDHGFALRKPVEQLLELDVKNQKRGVSGEQWWEVEGRMLTSGRWEVGCVAES